LLASFIEHCKSGFRYDLRPGKGALNLRENFSASRHLYVIMELLEAV